MAKIAHSDLAPAEAVHYVFGHVSFDIGGRKKNYETEDREVLAAADAHPWLTVTYDVPEVIQGAYVEQLHPKDDALSAQNSIANNPEEVRKAEEAKASGESPGVAIDAGKEQTEKVETGGVAETLAADETSKTSEKAGS